MEPFGGVRVLTNVGGENTGNDILKSLLTSSKIQKVEPIQVKILPDLESRTHTEEQIVFQIELGQPIKSEFPSNNENIIQHIPVKYLTADNQNLTSVNSETLVEPVTYVLSHDLLPNTTGYCTVANSEPQKIILMQEVESIGGPNVSYPESKPHATKESQTNECRYPDTWGLNWGVESRVVSEVKRENNVQSNEHLNKSVKKKKSEGSLGFQGKRNEEESSGSKGKVKKKVSTNRKPLKKKKNSKLKSKLKGGGKALVKKPKKEFDEGRAENSVKRKHLFELTKLEDSVDQVAERLKTGCDCTESNCFDGLNPHDVFKHRLNIADLTKAEHDMFLMGVIMASFHNLEETTRHKERIRIRSYYAYKGKKVCLTAFLYLQHVTLYQMKSLRNHLKNHGVSPKIHGNRGRKPANTFSLDIYRRAANFVQNYIEEHCVKTVPSFTPFSSNKIGSHSISGAHDHKTNAKKENKRKIASKMTLYHLPPEYTKRFVHGEYKTFCESLKPNQKVMKYSTFTNFLKKQFPNVKFHKKEEKRQERVIAKSEGTDKCKTNGRMETERCENTHTKLKEDQRVDKSIQVDKSLVYIPAKTQVIINGQRLELYDESGITQPGNRIEGEVLMSSASISRNVGQNQSEQYYAIDSTV